MNRRRAIAAICLVLLLGAYLLLRNSRLGGRTQDFIAVLQEKNHDVQTRRAKSLKWEDVKNGERFQYYDSVLTMADSKANIRFETGAELEIGSDSLVVLDPPLEKQSELRIDVKKGTATLHLKKGQKAETKNKVVVAKEDTLVKISQDSKNGENVVAVKDNLAKQIQPAEIAEIPAQYLPPEQAPKTLHGPKLKVKHQVFKFKRIDHPASIPSSFQKWAALFVPAAEAQTSNPADESVDGKLEWEELPGALSYEVEVAQDPAFASVILSKATNQTFIIWEMRKPGIFYWHVRGIDEQGAAGEFSEIGSFEVQVLPETIMPGQPSSPQIVTQPDFENAPPSAEPRPKLKTKYRSAPGTTAAPTPLPTPLPVEEAEPIAPSATSTPKPAVDYVQKFPNSKVKASAGVEYLLINSIDAITGGTSTLLSGASPYLSVDWDYSLSEKWIINAEIYGVSETVTEAQSSTQTLASNQGLRYSFYLGATRTFGDRLSLKLHVGEDQRLFFDAASANTVNVQRVLIPDLSADLNINIFRLGTYTLGAVLEGTYLASSSYSGYTIFAGQGLDGTLLLDKQLGPRSDLGVSAQYGLSSQNYTYASESQKNLSFGLFYKLAL